MILMGQAAGLKFDTPILKKEEVFVPHHLSAKWFSTPIQKSLSMKHRYRDRYHVVPGDFHTGQVIHNFQMSVNFSFNLRSLTSSKNFFKENSFVPL